MSLAHKKVTVAIVIPNHNGADLLETFLPSVVEASTRSQRKSVIYVVDNASTDESVALVRRRWPAVRVVESQENLLYGGGSNLGVRAATREFDQLEWLIFLNNDVYVPETFVDGITTLPRDARTLGVIGVKTLFLYPYVPLEIWHGVDSSGKDRRGTLLIEAIGLSERQKSRIRTGFPLGPKSGQWVVDRTSTLKIPIVGGSNLQLRVTHREDHDSRLFVHVRSPVQHWNFRLGVGNVIEPELQLQPPDLKDIVNNAGTFVDPTTGDCGDIGFFEEDAGQFDTPRRVDAACGVSMAVRREVFDQLHGFDENYSMYFEDTDLCVRAALCGYQTWYNPNVVIRHLHSATASELSDAWQRHVFRGNWIFRHQYQERTTLKPWKRDAVKRAKANSNLRPVLEHIRQISPVKRRDVPPHLFAGRSLCETPIRT